jgi:Mg2+ and Co2+ transporter CorA
MQVSFVSPTGVTDHGPDAVQALLASLEPGFVWVDAPEYDAATEVLLRDTFRAHPLVLQACAERNFVPTVHAYEDYLFAVVHAPLAGDSGHVHVLELDLVVGERYLVSVHGPRNPLVARESATEETDAIRRRVEARRLTPSTPDELAYSIVSAIARSQSAAVRSVAQRLPALEAEVMAADFHRPEELLEQLFLLRHELMTSRTMAAQAHDIQARIAGLERFVGDETRRHARDLADQFERVRNLADGESQFLVGVIDLYQTRVTTKMTVAMERLAVIAAITLPVTAIASVFGMNLIVNEETRVAELALVLAVMAGISFWLLRWARRQGWW